MFQKYQHIERIGTSEVQDILYGKCFVFPKLDGTNGSLWVENGKLKAGSRNRILTGGQADNAGFFQWASQQENIKKYFEKHPDHRLYGEWLVPHTIRTYEKDAWRKFYVFDVMIGEDYINYGEYKQYLEEFNIDYVPLIEMIINPTMDKIEELAMNNKYLVTSGIGEGVVVKNYEYQNKYGRKTWAKLVVEQFRETKREIWNDKIKVSIEEKIIDKFQTESFVLKEFNKIEDFNSSKIMRVLNVVFYTLIKEEAYEIIKFAKFGTIDFNLLRKLSFERTKLILKI